MAQRIISNTFSLTAYIGSKTYVNNLVVDQGKLHQFYDKDNGGKCSPDWETSTSEQPKFHFECRATDGTLQRIPPETTRLYYNETEITFNSSTKTNEGMFEGMFKYEDFPETGSAPAYRQYTIIKNVATAGNMDNDTLRIEGQLLTEGNNVEYVSTPTVTIHVIPVASGGSAYFMEIDAPAISSGNTSTTITAMVYKSDGTGEITSGISYKWERLDGDRYTQVGTSRTLKVSESEVIGFEHYRCTATIGGINIIGACSVFDYNDGIYVAYEITGVGNPTTMRDGETAKITAVLVDTNGNDIDISKKYPEAELTFTIVDKAGEVKSISTDNPQIFTYDTVVNTYGGSLTGYVTIE